MGSNPHALGIVLRDLLPPAGPRALMPAPVLVDLAALADDLGYDSIWIPEGRGRELFSLTGAMAVATSRVRLGTGILPLYSRPPALAAMAAATLGDLSGGRFVLGIGTGHPKMIERGFGVPFREPLAATREYIGILRRTATGSPVAADGRVFRVQAFQLEAAPRYATPIYVAALGPKMLQLAGQVADGVILNWSTPARVQWAAGVVREATRAAGRDPAQVQVVCYVRVAVAEDDEAWPVIRRLLATYVALPAYARMLEGAGFADAVRTVKAVWTRGGVEAAAAATPDQFVHEMALVGTGETCRRGLEAYQAAGAEVVIAYPVPIGSDAERSLRHTIEALAGGG
jgi:probable F420-dependent oxidoreductase